MPPRLPQNYDTSEAKLRREFDTYGTIKNIIMVHNTDDGKPRGYAFIEYEHERDMHCKCSIAANHFVFHLFIITTIDCCVSSIYRRIRYISVEVASHTSQCGKELKGNLVRKRERDREK